MLGKVPMCELLVSTIVLGALRDLERARRIRGSVYCFCGQCTRIRAVLHRHGAVHL
jgi:hypothetical protein